MKKHPTRDIWLGDDGKLYDAADAKTTAMSAPSYTRRDRKQWMEVYFFKGTELVRKHYGRALLEIVHGRVLKPGEIVDYVDGDWTNVQLSNLKIRRRKLPPRKEATIYVDLDKGNTIKIPHEMRGIRKIRITFAEMRGPWGE
jgi:hypothetical protein